MVGQAVQVAAGEGPTPGEEGVQPRDLGHAEGRRDVRQSIVVAQLDHRVRPVTPVGELARDPVVAEPSQSLGQVVAIGQDGAALASRHDLGRVQGQHRQVRQGPDGPSGERRAKRVRRVRDDRQGARRRLSAIARSAG